LQNGRALARFAFIWDGVPGAYQVSIDTTTQNTFLLQNFVQVAPSWEASSVTLYITPECVSDAECDDGNPCTSDTCEDYVCARAAVANGTTCDDGLYCNGVETCQNGDCTAGTAPCVDDAHCDEANDQCLSCVSDAECDDGLFCNGEETCVDGSCVPGTPPCVDDAHCDEANGQCLSCVSDAECDDGVFCNGTETCVDGSCTPGTPPCVDNAHCDENANTCLQCISDTECDDGNPCTIDTCQGNACVHTPAPDADNDSVCDAIDQCPSTPAGVAVDANGCSADQLNPAGEPTVDPNAPAADDLSQCCGDGTCGIGTGFTMVFMIVGMVAMRGWRRNRRR
jgi:hypothetical protein